MHVARVSANKQQAPRVHVQSVYVCVFVCKGLGNVRRLALTTGNRFMRRIIGEEKIREGRSVAESTVEGLEKFVGLQLRHEARQTGVAVDLAAV